MKFKLLEIEMAIDFVSTESDTNEAVLCKDNGQIYYQSVVDDLNDSTYIHIPSWQDFDLGSQSNSGDNDNLAQSQAVRNWCKRNQIALED